MISEELNTKWDKGELTTPKYIRALNEYAMSLEAKIAELETPRACDECIHISHRYGADCFGCMRLGTSDRYEPKDIK